MTRRSASPSVRTRSDRPGAGLAARPPSRSLAVLVPGTGRRAEAAAAHDPFGYLDRPSPAGQPASRSRAGPPTRTAWPAADRAGPAGRRAGRPGRHRGVASGRGRRRRHRADPRLRASRWPPRPAPHRLRHRRQRRRRRRTPRSAAGRSPCRRRSRAPDRPEIAAHSPFGMLEKASADGNTVTLTGWAADPDNLAQPLKILAGHRRQPAPRHLAKAVARPDIAQSQHVGPNQGFSLTITLSDRQPPGVRRRHQHRRRGEPPARRACLKLYVGYTAAQIAAHSPSGALEAGPRRDRHQHRRHAAGPPTRTTGPPDQRGRPTSTAAAARTVAASVPRPDLVDQPAGRPDTPATPSPSPAGTGAHNVCLWAVNIGIGTNKFLGCAALSTPAVADAARPGAGDPGRQHQDRHAGRKTSAASPTSGAARSPATGFDCSGLVQYSYRTAAGIDHAAGRPGPVHRGPDDPGRPRGAR